MNFDKLKNLPRHKDCEDSRCLICLKDSIILMDFLDDETENLRDDMLGRYASWLRHNDIEYETEHGWFSQNAWNPVNIENFIKYYKGE